MSSRLRVVIFDLGNTLVGDPRTLVWRRLAADGFGGLMPPETSTRLVAALRRADGEMHDVRSSHFLGELELIRIARASTVGVPALAPEEALLQAYRQTVISIYHGHPELVAVLGSEFLELIATLRSHGVERVGILSNERRWAPLIYLRDVIGIDAETLDFVVTSDQTGFGKPDRRMFVGVARSMDAAASECVVIGDSLENDIRPALSLSMVAVWATRYAHTSRKAPPGALVVQDIRDLLWVLGFG